MTSYLKKSSSSGRLTRTNVLQVIAMVATVFSLMVSSLIISVSSPVKIAAAEEPVRLNMKSYGNHNPTYDYRILSIRPEYVIDNPPHGLYGEMEEQQYHEGYTYDWLLQDVAGYQAAGIKVIGYITCGYEGGIGEDTGGDGYDPYWYSLSLNKMLITNMATIDGVDGVFIDECSSYPHAASKAYLKELTDLAHSYGLITWGNTGVDQFDDWFFTEGGFDLMQSSENWHGQSLSQVQQDWGHRISVTGFRSSYTAQDAYELTIDAWEKGLAYCYINNREYTSIAPWFEEYVGMLRNYEQGQDTAPPYTSGHIPAKASTGIARDTQITLHLGDDGSGVDQSSIIMTVEGSVVTPTITGTAADYTLTYNPPTDFAYGQVVDVTVDAQDLASSPNMMAQDAYSFTIASESAPLAEFGAIPTTGNKPLSVQFSDQSSGSITSWSWDFGDGATSTLQHPSHAYANAGIYTVSLTVTDSLSTSDTETKADYIAIYDPGDANGDGSVNSLDITKLKRIIMGLDDPTPGADANGDGNTNALDVTQIELIIMGG